MLQLFIVVFPAYPLILVFSPGSGGNRSAPEEKACVPGMKKEIKMWFSPRSRKMRFTLKRRSQKPEAVVDKGNQPHALTSTYDFISSPPQETFGEEKKHQPKCKKKLRKKTLKDINQQWGLLERRRKNISGYPKDSSSEIKANLVSFCSQTVVIPSPDLKCTSEKRSVQNESELHTGGSTSVKTTSKSNSMCDFTEESLTSEECLFSRNSATKRGRQLTGSPTSLRKRSKRKEQNIQGRSSLLKKLPGQSPQNLHGKTSPTFDAVRSSRSGITSALKNSEGFQCASGETFPGTPLKSNNVTQKGTQQTEASSKKPNNSSLKRNHKGETLLHIASIEVSLKFGSKPPNALESTGKRMILTSEQDSRCDIKVIFKYCVDVIQKEKEKGTGKEKEKEEEEEEEEERKPGSVGDLSSVEHLLKSGADPNVKDYAGWTPLHEACNHGHKEIVELLLQHGALLNATGYQNDLPLHDAVKNGHMSIVELLLSHGASRDAVNIFGRKPVDYAETEEMKLILMLSSKNKSSVTHCGEQVNRNHPREGPVVLLGSGLGPAKQQLLSKLAVVLKGSICMEFNSTVTHVIIPEHPVRSTMKCMMAVLTGCWILTFKWVEVCLQMGAREIEEKYEIDGGPRRGRLNKEQLLPKLFDGCYFYFLGVFKEHNKDDLKELVKAGGGQILLRKPKSDNDVTQAINTIAYHADINSDQSFCTQYIIYDGSSHYTPEKIRQGKVWEVPSKWLIDCVMSFQLLPVKQ
ncbi:hypothetical protein JD844_023301 [Phrynosoma platyrhinos]|uniref:BRCT domain-containing protein n=1 Tax=Phrynosoma platyrhinos TaxID=52577 RepID=A0ABQ7SWT2_PHRPL|nr:hypothetical protein JD844_023301 [Phrynosoma platyrhinos]